MHQSMMRVVLLFIFYFSYLIGLKAQQSESFYGHYFYNPVFVNPAFTGIKGNVQALLIGKKQWSGFSGAPQLNMVLVDGKLKSKKVGLGIQIINDTKGFSKRNGGSVLYSYSLDFDRTTHLSFGLSLGAINTAYLFSNAITENISDPILSTGNQSSTGIVSGVGLSFVSKKLEIGFSLPQLLGSKLKYNSLNGSNAILKQPGAFFTYVRYNHPLSKEKLIFLSPVLSVRTVSHSPLQYDAGILFDWKNKFWVGATYKSKYALSTCVGFTLYNRLSIGYSYDMVNKPLSSYSGLSHEIMINIVFGKIIQEPVVDSTEGKKLRNLNDLLIERLIAEVDAIYENPNATEQDYINLIDKISQFSDSYTGDPNLTKQLKEYAEKLQKKQHDNEPLHVVIKGKVELMGQKKLLGKNYADVSIALYDEKTNVAIGSYKPKERNGKFILIVKPGESYVIEVQKEGYKPYSKTITPKLRKSSYELQLSVRLKKQKKSKAKPK